MSNLKYDTNELIYKTETDSEAQRINLVVAKEEVGVEESWTGSLGLADANYYTQNGETTRACYIAQGTTFNIL